MPYISAGSIFHAQENRKFCGAAAALTMLSDGDIGLAAKDLSESLLFGIGHGHNTQGWGGIDPDGFVFLMNNPVLASGAPVSSRVEFTKKDPTSEPEGTAKIVAAVAGTQAVAVAALVHGHRHWVTVNGIEVDRNPLEGQYTLLKLWVFDPEAQMRPQPPHGDNDDCPELGVDKFMVCYRGGWQRMFNGAFLDCATRFVSISQRAVTEISLPKFVKPPDVSVGIDSHGLIRPEFIGTIWGAWVDALGGWPDDSPGVTLRDVTPVGFNKVTWLGEEDVFYLFRLERSAGLNEAGEIVATGVMDARSGNLHSVKIYTALSVHRPALERLRGDLVEADMVWQPCLESFSPHLPFRMAEDGGSYERLDKQFFDILTGEIHGM